MLKLHDEYMRLWNVTDCRTQELLGKNCIYYPNEVRSIQILNEVPEKTDDPEESKEEKAAVKVPKIPMTKATLKRVFDSGDNIILIQSYDSTYHNAIEDVQNQRVIGLNIENVESGRLAKHPAFLSIGTTHCVYLFDMIALKGVGAQLKRILQSEKILKVVHFSKYLIDFLRNTAQTKLHNFFDTMVSIQNICCF